MRPVGVRAYLQNASLLAIQSTLQRLIGIVVNVVLARTLGPNALGIYNAIQTTASSAYGFVRVGMDNSMHVEVARAMEQRDDQQAGSVLAAGLAVLVATGLLGALACVLLSETLAVRTFGQPELGPWLRWSGLLVVTLVVQQYSYVGLAGLHQFKTYSIVSVWSSVLTAILSAGGALLWGLSGLIAATVVSAFVSVTWMVLALSRVLKRHGIRLRAIHVRSTIMRLARRGVPFYLSGFVLIPATYYMQGLLARSHGLDSLGQLRVVVTLTALVTFIPSSIAAATVSVLSSATVGEAREVGAFGAYAEMNLRIIWLGTTLVAVGSGIVLPFLLPLVYGAAYASSVTPAVVALFAASLAATEGVMGQVLFTSHRSHITLVLLTSRAAVSVSLSYVLIPMWGLKGYVGAELIGFVLSIVVGMAVVTWVVRSTTKGTHVALVHLRHIGATALLFGAAISCNIGVIAMDVPVFSLVVVNVFLLMGFCFGAWQYALAPDERTAMETWWSHARTRIGRPTGQ